MDPAGELNPEVLGERPAVRIFWVHRRLTYKFDPHTKILN
jgi:hypothetical protein